MRKLLYGWTSGVASSGVFWVAAGHVLIGGVTVIFSVIVAATEVSMLQAWDQRKKRHHHTTRPSEDY